MHFIQEKTCAHTQQNIGASPPYFAQHMLGMTPNPNIFVISDD